MGIAEGWEIRERVFSAPAPLEIPNEWKIRQFEVYSGDSGNRYLVHSLTRMEERILLCTCDAAKFKMPLVVVGSYQCKHARQVSAWLEAFAGQV